MTVAGNDDDPSAAGSGRFLTTHWSVVLSARLDSSPDREAALVKLCQTYWYPLYAYIRRRGHGFHEAEDLVQSFFAHVFERDLLRKVNREKGRFRSFLLGSLNYFLADARDRQNAQKRGGGREFVSFDAQEAEGRYQLEPVTEQSPERIFERRWAMTLLDSVLARLRQEFVTSGKEPLFTRLQDFLVPGDGDARYAHVAAQTGMTEEGVKKAVQRMRKRYQQLFREEVAQTIADPLEVEAELRHLCGVLGS